MTNSDSDDQDSRQEAKAVVDTQAQSGFSLFDDQDVQLSVLNSSLTRLVEILDNASLKPEPIPVIRLKKENVDLLTKETMLSKAEVEALLTAANGDLQAAIRLYLEAPIDKAYI